MNFQIDDLSYNEFLEYKQFLAFKNGTKPVEKQEIPKQEPLAIAVETSSVQPQEQIRIIKFDRVEILSAVKGILMSQKKYYTSAIILEKLNRMPKYTYVTADELIVCLNSSALSDDKIIKRCMIAPNIYIYGYFKTVIPNVEKILYNPDARNGQAMFNNLRSTVMRVAKSFNRPFSAEDVKSVIMNEMYFVREKNKRDLRDGINTTLGQLCNPLKPGQPSFLDKAGKRGNMIYDVRR